MQYNYNTIAQESIIFEHPMSEEMRIFLCLESLFIALNQATQHSEPQQALTTLLKIINILDRPDIKNKICQRLNLYATSLNQLKQFKQVDLEKLEHILGKIDALKSQLHQQSLRFAENLKRTDFLGHLRQHVALPGGLAYHNSYALKTWLHQPIRKQLQDIHSWSQQLNTLEDSVILILKLTRQTTDRIQAIADNGYYEKMLNNNLPIGLVRVITSQNTYPEISGSRHRLSIRFIKPDFFSQEHCYQIQEDIPFELILCQL
jgi:cell division protein ZapD